jgi:hypothetical protein
VSTQFALLAPIRPTALGSGGREIDTPAAAVFEHTSRACQSGTVIAAQLLPGHLFVHRSNVGRVLHREGADNLGATSPPA